MSSQPPTLAERFKLGKALRAQTPRELHADLRGPLGRDAVAILAESDKNRVPELLPERYRRMTVNAFAFLRGAAAVMASDLADQPIAGAPVQACGDCHLMNFGAFNTPENNILFDINDFDETLPGVDFTVDVKRLAASVAAAAKAASMPGRRARSLAAKTVGAYRAHMFGLMELSPLEIWHSRIDLEEEVERIKDPQLRRDLLALIVKARAGGLEEDDNFPHLVTGDEPKIADRPPTIFHFGSHADPKHRIDAARAFELYRATLRPERAILVDRYHLRDLAFKAVGVGSVGTFCCVGLFMNPRRPSPVPSGEGGAKLGAGTTGARACLSWPARQTRRRRPADHASGERRFSRLDLGRSVWPSILCPRPEESPAGRGQ
jgi:hypothetical protein